MPEGGVPVTDEELLFCGLCASLEDAIQLMDAGCLDAARALLERTLDQARRLAEGGGQ